MSTEKFTETVQTAYTFTGKSIVLGGPVFEKKNISGFTVQLPLATVNRHGLIAGATGTGKTKTIQRFAESLSEQGVNVLLMDIKGDISGISKPGSENPKVKERMTLINLPWLPTNYPTELLTISKEKGLRMRATVSEFGPTLFSKILELNANQEGALAIVFKYCDDKKMPLLDIKDFREVLQYLTNNEEGKKIVQQYGQISSTTSGVIMRKLLELEQQGADKFFGEKSFEVEDLLRKDKNGNAFINIIRLCDMQDKPKLFSTFMLCLLAEIYQKFPELGDKAAPKLVIFIDEAHLIFRDATKTLMQQLETVIKLIRSKGVGIFFCTQIPGDIPDNILSQLGSKFQHAMRAFTAKDRKDIKLVAENYPSTKFYDTETLITELGIGEAFVTVLDEKGAPTPLAHTLLCAPRTRMDVLTPEEQDTIVSDSEISDGYNEVIDRKSAYEMLSEKIENAAEEADDKSVSTKGKETKESTIMDKISDATKNPMVKTVMREVTRGIFGMLFGKSSTRR